MENKECSGCKPGENRTGLNIPYFVHEGEMARAERHIKRLWIALIIAILVAFLSNIAWLIYDAQYDKTSYEQDGSGINNFNIGEQGDLNNGPENQAATSEK